MAPRPTVRIHYTDHFHVDQLVKRDFNWKFGFEKRWMKTTGEKLPSGAFDDAGVQGVFNFSNFQTASPAAASATGDSFASFLLGLVDNASRTYNGPGIAAKFGYTDGYALTDWRVRPNLTINLGLRYEIAVPRQTDPTEAFTSFDPNLVDPHSGLKEHWPTLAIAGLHGRSRFGDIDYSAWGPRIMALLLRSEDSRPSGLRHLLRSRQWPMGASACGARRDLRA
jgi:hypothetical protein